MSQCISVHANIHMLMWGLILLMMRGAATLRCSPQEQHYHANLFVFPTKHKVVALTKSPRSAHLCSTPPRLIITSFHQRDTIGRGGARDAKRG